MLNFIIKTHHKETLYKGNQIFILNKGLNSGKPQKEPFKNSFVIQFSNQEDAETVYWLAYSLWKAKFWHPHLVGSVIPFLRLQNFKTKLIPIVDEMMEEHVQHLKCIKDLKLLELQENQSREHINLINNLRLAIIHRYFQK